MSKSIRRVAREATKGLDLRTRTNGKTRVYNRNAEKRSWQKDY